MSTGSPPTDDDLTPEEAEELEAACAESEEDERAGRLVAWESLFPRE